MIGVEKSVSGDVEWCLMMCKGLNAMRRGRKMAGGGMGTAAGQAARQ